MLKRGKLIATALAACLCLGQLTGVVKAEDANVPNVTVTTEKDKYDSGEEIKGIIEIKNPTKHSLNDIILKGTVPEGYFLQGDKEQLKQWQTEMDKIVPGAAAKYEFSFIAKEADKTGDVACIALWTIVGMAGMSVAVLARKKKIASKILSILVVCAMTVPIMVNGVSTVNADDSDTDIEAGVKIIEVEKEFTINGEKQTISIKVEYEELTELSYDGYDLKWSDEFDGDVLNRDDWNVELHEPGWVNEELQEYVDSTENIYIKDGKLVLKPIKSEDGNGNAVYTSGRVNTQNKHDFTYGLFEARLKVPEGKGYLPAFWLMATDENVYGQWPRCGEIDIMEIHGSETTTNYGTIHYGNPHGQSQGKSTLDNGTYSDEFHTFAVEWEPGKISWYVDGILFHTESDWYSVTEGQGEITYPAPFDQPFYVILNLAVGNNWAGYPDATTDFENAAYEIDYVRVYQKESYDENVTKPVKNVVLREPDASGNYVINGAFNAEDLQDSKGWSFMTALEGNATAELNNNELVIKTTNAGTVDYSVQMVQPNIPMKKGATYKLTFDAYANADRAMNVALTAPNLNYIRYFKDAKVELSTSKQSYEYEFTMTGENDANGRLEFNMGAVSTADIHISNVKLVKVSETELIESEEKTVLTDGNYIYNGRFQEGEGRLGFWDITNDIEAKISVTNFADGRRLKFEIPENVSSSNSVILSQNGLALSEGNKYELSFNAQGDAGKKVQVAVAGQTYVAELTGEEKTYTYKLDTTSVARNGLSSRDIVIKIMEPGTFYIDEIRLVEDSLIKNGNFSAGLAGFEPYAYNTNNVTWIVDSLTEDNAIDFTINDTGDQAWHIQLKQNGIELEKGQWYRLTLDAKSSIDRELMFAIQRDGSKHNDDWTPYSGERVVELGSGYQTYTLDFKMTEETDLESVLSISMGAVAGTQITEQHRICIDNIKLETIEAPVIEDAPAGENLLTNADFSQGLSGWENAVTAPGEATTTVEDNKLIYNITKVGTADWNIQLKQLGLQLEKGCTYRMRFNVNSSEARTIKAAFMSTTYSWYGGADLALGADVDKAVDFTFEMTYDTDINAGLYISMGIIEGVDTPASTITLSDFSLEKVEE